MLLEPCRLTWTFNDLPSADAHTLNCRFTCSIRIADSEADRKMFAEVFSEASIDDKITAHFEKTLRSALASLVSQCKAADVVGGPDSPKWIATLTNATKSLAFSCGLELLAPFQLDVESPSLQRQRIEEIARSRAKERAAGQIQDIQRAGELLKQFQSLRQCAPDMPAGKLLEQLSPADRGLTLQSLLLATSGAKTGAALWAVAGCNLLQIDPRSAPPRVEVIPVPADLGPCRSAAPARMDGQPILTIGAQKGVLILSPSDPSTVKKFSCDTGESQLGFNRIAFDGKTIWASHSDVGIVAWQIDQPSEPHIFSQRGARHLHLLDDSRLLYALGNELVVRAGESLTKLESPSNREIVAIIPTPSTLLAIHEDGTIAIVDRCSAKVIDVRRRPASISAACAMPWLGDVRLLLATDQGPIDCVGLEDSVTTEYLSPYRGLKILSATTDLVAAVSPDRQRIVLWNSWDGQRPLGEIHVTARTKHRVADLRFESA